MNEHLITQVKAGTHCISHTRFDVDMDKLATVLRLCFPKYDQVIFGSSKYYYKHPYIADRWQADSHHVPTGLTPIPLDDFFKEEDAATNKYCSCGDPSCEQFNPPTPDQPALPEYTFDDIARAIVFGMAVESGEIEKKPDQYETLVDQFLATPKPRTEQF